MYDYRQDLIDLLKHTDDSDDDLKQTLRALIIFLKAQNLIKIESDSKIKSALTKTISKSKPVHAQPNIQPRYQVKRLLAGCKIIDQNEQQIVYYNEKTTRFLGLHNGDTVTLRHRINQNNVDEYLIENINTDHETDDGIITFGPAVIKANDQQQLFVNKTVNNERLSEISNGTIMQYILRREDIENMSLKPGDIIELAWYKDHPDLIRVRWRYPELNLPTSTVSNKHSDYQIKTKQNNTYQPKIKYDLENSTVAIVAADKGLVRKADSVIKAHHGISCMAISENINRIYDTVKSYDYAVLIKSYVSHEISQGLRKRGINFTMAETAGQLDLEKAVYRVINHLTVDDNSNIDYPLV